MPRGQPKILRPPKAKESEVSSVEVTVEAEGEDAVSCFVCNGQHDAHLVLICDGVTSDGDPCPNEIHTYCLNPQLPGVPDGVALILTRSLILHPNPPP